MFGAMKGIGFLALTTTVAASLQGCSAPVLTPPVDAGVEAAAACSAYEVPSSTDLTAPTVSFRNDVTPLFNASCGAATCHGSATSARVFLGSNTASTGDPSAIRTGLVGVNSSALPTMPFVTAGDPKTSFLQHKIDGDLCTLAPQCTDGDCGSTMPEGKPLIAVSDRDTIRRWIAQGAVDN